MKVSISFLTLLLNRGEAWSSSSTTTFHSSLSSRSKVCLQSTKSASSDFNVVLKPSNDPEAFDSSKIGAARVHRYIRDDSDGDSEYVMW